MAEKPSEIDAILQAVGIALHNWSRVEGVLVELLFRCMETRTAQPATIVWGNVVNLEPKLNIISQMLPLIISDEKAIELWEEIRESVYRRNRKRAGLAHYEIVDYDDGPRLVPKYQSWDSGKLAHADTTPENAFDRLLENYETRGYRSFEIMEIAENFSVLKIEVRWYIDWVVNYKQIHPVMGEDDPPPLIKRFLGH